MELKFIGQGLDPDSDITTGNFIFVILSDLRPFHTCEKTGESVSQDSEIVIILF